MPKQEHGAFWEQKIKTFAHVVDFNKDGFITHEDYEQMAKNYIDVGGLGRVESKKISRKFAEIWEKFFSETEKSKGKLTLEDFVEDKRRHGKKALTRAANEIFQAVFDLIDFSGDGTISPVEFAQFYKIVDLDAETAAETFKQLDTDHDDKLSAKEFVTAGIDFFNSDDESSPSKHLFGPLLA